MKLSDGMVFVEVTYGRYPPASMITYVGQVISGTFERADYFLMGEAAHGGSMRLLLRRVLTYDSLDGILALGGVR